MPERTEDEADSPGALRQTLTLLVKIVVSAGLLYLLLGRTDLSRLWSYVRSASPAWLALALLLYFVMILLSVWRWRILLDAQHISVPPGRCSTRISSRRSSTTSCPATSAATSFGSGTRPARRARKRWPRRSC